MGQPDNGPGRRGWAALGWRGLSVPRSSRFSLLTRYAVAWLYLAGFIAAAVTITALPSHYEAAVQEWASTNVANLRHDPLGSLLASAFITPGIAVAWPVMIALVMFGATRVLGNWRTLLVCGAGHVAGTLVSEGVVAYRIAHGLLPASSAHILDIGPSYVVVSAITVVALYGSRLVRVAATGELIQVLGKGQVPLPSGVAFSPDGTRLAAVGHSGMVDAWDVRTGREVWGAARRTGPGNLLTGVAWSPGGRHLAVADYVGVYILDAATGRELPPLDRQVGALGVAYGPDGRRLAVACLDKTVRVWDTKDRTMQTLAGHEAHVRSVAYRFDGQYLASAGEDGLVIVWDATDADRIKVARRIRAHRDIIDSVAFSPDGRRLATGGRDGTVKIWDADTGALRRLIRARQQEVYAVAYHPDGKRLASAGADGTVKTWEAP